MYVILVYDVNVKRVAKVLKKCREYLFWVQNSVFEGELTKAQIRALKHELNSIINEDTDSVIIYILENTKYTNIEVIGKKKGGEELLY